MPPDHRPSRERDADRSRQAILDAAEQLFADKGYEATTIQEIADRAGLSRGAPTYFFGSKEALYRAVLNRVFGEAKAMVSRIRTNQQTLTPEAAVSAAVSDYLDFLVSHPRFMRLVEWEVLMGGRFLGELPAVAETSQEGIAASFEAAGPDELRPVDRTQLLISLMALCWFPLAMADTLLRSLGIDARSPEFTEQRKQHVIDLLLHGLLPR